MHDISHYKTFKSSLLLAEKRHNEGKTTVTATIVIVVGKAVFMILILVYVIIEDISVNGHKQQRYDEHVFSLNIFIAIN